MARGPSYRVPFRRRREGKTDYKLRRALVMSNLPRFVARNTLKHFIVQFFEAKVHGDETIISAHSSELIKSFGWRGYCGNIPSAYLTGLLAGYRAQNNGVEKAVLDIGLHSSSRGARVYASLKGVLDAGIMVPHDENILPDESRLRGEHIVQYAKMLSSDTESYEKNFSRYLSRGLRPEHVPDHFSQIKENMISSLKEKED